MPEKLCTGFEFATTAGLVLGNTGNRIADAVVTSASVTIVAAAARTGGYGLKIDASAAAVSLGWNTNTFGSSQNRGVASFWFKFPTSLPGSTVIFAQFSVATLNGQVRFNSSTSKVEVGIENNTFQAGPVISADTWYHIEIYYNISANSYTLDWWFDGTAKTQATASSTAGSLAEFQLGDGVNAQTFTCYYDDLVLWTDTANITGAPFGKHKVLRLSVDTGASVTLSGTAANFQTYADATPTFTAWDATTARNNIDEEVLNTGSAQDGACQIATATTEYIAVPLTTYTLAGGESVNAARMLLAGWAATTTAATIGMRSYNGTTERTLFAAADPNFDNTATPFWLCKMLTLADVDAQSEIDALVARVGFSGDASPKIGFHLVLVEIAVKESGVTTVNGTAALSGDGALAASASLTVFAAAALSGVGTLAAIAKLTVFAATALSGVGSLNAVGAIVSFGTTTLSASGTLVAVGTRIVPGVTVLSASGSLSAAASLTVFAASALSGIGSLSVNGIAVSLASVTFAAVGTLGASGIVIETVTYTPSRYGMENDTSPLHPLEGSTKQTPWLDSDSSFRGMVS